MKDEARSIRDWADATEGIARAWIFGSRARGDHRPDSDIDVAIQICRVGRYFGPAEVFSAFRERWQEELQARLEPPLHLLPFGHTAGTRAVLPEWILVYEDAATAPFLDVGQSQASFDAAEKSATSGHRRSGDSQSDTL